MREVHTELGKEEEGKNVLNRKNYKLRNSFWHDTKTMYENFPRGIVSHKARYLREFCVSFFGFPGRGIDTLSLPNRISNLCVKRRPCDVENVSTS